jgi:hypothetical protein
VSSDTERESLAAKFEHHADEEGKILAEYRVLSEKLGDSDLGRTAGTLVAEGAQRHEAATTATNVPIHTAHHRVSSGRSMMTINEHDCVVLTQDVREAGLEAGDIGTVVHVHGNDAGYEVEFITLAGETVAVVTLRPAQVRSIQSRDVAHVRELAATGS